MMLKKNNLDLKSQNSAPNSSKVDQGFLFTVGGVTNSSGMIIERLNLNS